MRRKRSSPAPETGAAAVEFGLISVALFTLLLGIIQFSLWFWGYQVGAHGAREGARQYAVHPCDDHSTLIEERVGSAADGAVNTPGATVTNGVGLDPGTTEVGDDVTVSVSFAPHEIGPFLALPDIDKSATARIESVPAGGC